MDPASLVGELESVTGLKRESWPIATVRAFCDVLLEVADGRKLSPRHEVRWLNLFGYCLRPGFGDPQDRFRMIQARRIYQVGLAFPRELQSPGRLAGAVAKDRGRPQFCPSTGTPELPRRPRYWP